MALNCNFMRPLARDESAVLSFMLIYGLRLSVTFVRPSSETTIHD